MNSATLAAPLRSEAFLEDLPEWGTESSIESPWTLREAVLAALLCAVPVVLATLGGLVNFVATGA